MCSQDSDGVISMSKDTEQRKAQHCIISGSTDSDGIISTSEFTENTIDALYPVRDQGMHAITQRVVQRTLSKSLRPQSFTRAMQTSAAS